MTGKRSIMDFAGAGLPQERQQRQAPDTAMEDVVDNPDQTRSEKTQRKKRSLAEVFAIVLIPAFLCPGEIIWAAESKRSAAITPVVVVPAASSLLPVSRNVPHENGIPVVVSRQRTPSFFSYLEFDFDTDVSGRVPGFGPMRTQVE